MEELKFKLNHGDATIVANVCDRIYAQIVKNLKAGAKSEELELLWQELKTSPNPTTATSAAKLITQIALSEENCLNVGEVLTSFLTAAFQVQHPEGLVWGIGTILWHSKPTSYGIAKPPHHPYVTLLRSSPERMWPMIASQINHDLETDPERAIAIHKSVMCFILIDPHAHAHFAAMRMVLIQGLFHQIENEHVNSFLKHAIAWLPLETCSNQMFQELTLLVVLPWLKMCENSKMAYLSSLALQSVQRGLDPRPILKEMKLCGGVVDDLSVVILTSVLESCTFDHMADIVSLVRKDAEILHPFTLGIFVSALFQLVAYPNKLMPSLNEDGTALVKLFYSVKSHSQGDIAIDKKSLGLIDINIATAVKVLQSYESNVHFSLLPSRRKFHVLSSKLLLTSSDADQLLDKIQQVVEKDRSLSPRALTLIMHKLSLLTRNSPISSGSATVKKLLESLTTLAKDKSCVASILALLNFLGNQKGLEPLKLNLLFLLWKSEPRCYVYLQKAIESDFSPPNEKVKLNWLLAKANCILRICETAASKHGADLLKPLTDLLNSTSDDMSVVMLALKGITILCKEGVIDIMTTVKVLTPKFNQDTRIPVLAKFYQLLAVSPSFNLESETYQNFLKSTLAMMWKNCNDASDVKVRAVIVDAIRAFSIELHELRMLPDYAKVGIEASDSEEQPITIPGNIWINILKQNITEDAFGSLIVSFVKGEVSNLPRGVHHLSQAMKNRGEEHTSYNFLPETSVLRAIMTRLIQDKSDEELCKVLFKILSLIEQPLPPYDWRLLPMTKRNKFSYIGVLARQCSRSFSAKAILQEFAAQWSIGEIALDLMPHFAHLIKGVRLKDHVIFQSLELWYQSAVKDKTCMSGFKSLLKSLIEVAKEVGSEEEDQVAVKETAIDVIMKFHNQVLMRDAHPEIIDYFHKNVIDLPHYVVEKLADTEVSVLSALMIRQNLAIFKSQPSLAAMNGIIDVFAKEDNQNLVEMRDLKVALIEVLKVTKAKQLKQWILEIMGQILFLLRQNCSVWTFNFMFDMFVFSIAALADNCDPELDCESLPMGLYNLLNMDKYADLGPHFAEWLMELERKETTVSDSCKMIIRQSWRAIKITEGYKESSIWGRLCML